jgi:hypothetical protein
MASNTSLGYLNAFGTVCWWLAHQYHLSLLPQRLCAEALQSAHTAWQLCKGPHLLHMKDIALITHYV